MNVLGVHDAFDAGAAIVTDGALCAAVNEERLNQQKYFHEKRKRFGPFPNIVTESAFPELSIRWLLEYTGLEVHEIDAVVLPSCRPGDFFTRILPAILQTNPGRALALSGVLIPMAGLYALNKRNLLASTRARLQKMGFPLKCVRMVDHHDAHAASAYRTSGWDSALVVTIDLEGDLVSTTIQRAEGHNMTLLGQTFFPLGSAGGFYGDVTECLGFRKHMDECKVMGLAAYGSPRWYDEISHNLSFDADSGHLRSEKVFGFKKLVKRLLQDNDEDKKDMAASIQNRLEDVVTQLFGYWIEKTGLHRVAYAGGVAHNVILNQRLQEMTEIEDLHVFPQIGDGGLGCGGALAVWYDQVRPEGQYSVKLPNAYLGPEYSDDDILSALAAHNLPANKADNHARRMGEYLSQSKVCGLFQGRMELGPRALGNRSILCSPQGEEHKDIVNNKVKFRESWRPFALSILEDHMDDYLINAYPSKFMLLGFQVKPERLADVRSASHVDSSTRPQTVTREDNPRYYAVIDAFREITGIPGVLNTSLNRRGEPICCTPENAIQCFLGSGMDVLSLNDFIITKEDVPAEQVQKFQTIEKDVRV